MKTIQVEDNQEALDMLLRHNAFARGISEINDEVVRLYAVQIAVLRLVEKAVRDGAAPIQQEARDVIEVAMTFLDGEAGFAGMKHYGSRELADAVATLAEVAELGGK